MKKLGKRLALNRETVLCMQNLRPIRVAGLGGVGIVAPPTQPVTSPLCVSTCCGGCETEAL